MINSHDLMTWLQPYFLSIVGAVLTYFASIVSTKVNQYLGFKISQAQWDVVHSTALAAAGKIWAHADASISTAQIHSSNPLIVDAANEAIALIPTEVARLGVTPESLAKLITSKLGELQASSGKPQVSSLPFMIHPTT